VSGNARVRPAKKVVVSTTINPPTEAIERFDSLPDWELVVVGDAKTPKDYRLRRGVYLPLEEQMKMDPHLSELIGHNCIQRRNFGFLIAHRMGADIVATVDDDNIPYEGWGQGLLIESAAVKARQYTPSDGVALCFDPVHFTNYPHLWHRGFPIDRLRERGRYRNERVETRFDIQADFWDGDPDIDAICRMEHSPECSFDPACFPMSTTVFSPFNSQNTFLRREVLPHYFMLPHVGRMDDIWAGYLVEAMGFRVVYQRPSVRQQRNPHNLLKDFENESLGYLRTSAFLEGLRGANPLLALQRLVPERTFAAYLAYRKHFPERGEARNSRLTS